MADGDLRRHAEFMDQRAEPEAQRLHADEIDLVGKKPARVIFAKAGRRDERQVFKFQRIGLQVGARLERHEVSTKKTMRGEGGR